jgi:hypothetical protein
MHDVLAVSSGLGFTRNLTDADLRAQMFGTGEYLFTFITVFLHPYSETSWDDQVTKEPLVERTVRAVNHARETLLAGFTTVRFVIILLPLRLSNTCTWISARSVLRVVVVRERSLGSRNLAAMN